MQLGETAAVDAALDALSVSVDHLVKLVDDGGLETCTEAQLVGFLQGFERVRNRLPLVDHQMINEMTRRDVADSLCQASLPRMLTTTLRISVPEAARRVRAAE